MLISSGGGGKELLIGVPTLTLVCATEAETHWKNWAKLFESIVSKETTVSVNFLSTFGSALGPAAQATILPKLRNLISGTALL